MVELNPYQASQLTGQSQNAANIDPELMADALGPNWLRVCDGARLCGNAVSLVILSVLFTILGMIIIGTSASPILFFWLLQFLLFVSAIMQSVGLSRMKKVSEKSGARKILSYAFGFQIALLILSVGGHIYSFLDSRFFGLSRGSFFQIFGVGQENVYVSFISFGIGLAYNILTYMGLRQIGIAIENRKVRMNGTAAIIAQCTLLLMATVFMVMAFLRFGSQGASNWRNFIGGGTIVSLVIGLTYLVMISFYSSALRYISNYIKEYAKLTKLMANASPDFGITPPIPVNIPVAESADS